MIRVQNKTQINIKFKNEVSRPENEVIRLFIRIKRISFLIKIMELTIIKIRLFDNAFSLIENRL
jgi:hypothetical protein